jgi:RNA polymerase sigma-70 factor (ECF subfamily)
MSIKVKSDEQLISSYLAGSEKSLNIVINRHRSRLLYFIVSKVNDISLAEDIFQDTYIKVINTLKRGMYNEQGKFISWVTRIAHNLIIDYYRKIKKNKFIRSNESYNIFDFVSDTEQSKEDLMINERISSELKLLINYLPENQKNVLKMRFYSNMSFAEIAESQNLSINTALGRMRYALINLRKIIKSKQLSIDI